MRRLGIIAPLLAALLTPSAAIAQAPAASGVTVYRCTDSKGQLVALRDSPCRSGERQEVVRMQRPQDPPPRTASTAAAPAPPAADPLPREVRVVTVQAPRPMYECTAPDGTTYTSDSDEGNQRWVPLWTLGYPAVRPKSVLGDNIGHPDRVMHPPPHDVIWPVATGGGGWIRDDCAMLPPREACARLRDRRSEIRTRFFNAMPSERDVLRVEERTINARLDNDCGGH